MIINEYPRLRYRCPSCSLPYLESAYRSYGMLGFAAFSDGSVDPLAHRSLWLTRCPCCHAYFAKKHLLPLEAPLDSDEPCGSLDRDREKRYSIPFWESVLARGLFFPDTVDMKERRETLLKARISLWQAANRNRVGFGEGKYQRLCRALLCEIAPERDTDRLTVAELYRNLGDFDAALGALLFVREKRKHAPRFSAIERAALGGHKETVKLNIT